MYGIRFWKGNAAFNRQKDHDFAPNEWFRQTVVAECKFASFDKGGDAEKMRRCEHFHWAFEHGVPNDVIRCKDCGYWQYL